MLHPGDKFGRDRRETRTSMFSRKTFLCGFCGVSLLSLLTYLLFVNAPLMRSANSNLPSDASSESEQTETTVVQSITDHHATSSTTIANDDGDIPKTSKVNDSSTSRLNTMISKVPNKLERPKTSKVQRVVPNKLKRPKISKVDASRVSRLNTTISKAQRSGPNKCEYPTLEDVFGVDKGNYDMPDDEITFTDKDCVNTKEYCSTNIKCANGLHKNGDISLKCSGPHWIYTECLREIEGLKCQLMGTNAIKCSWTNIQDIAGAKYFVKLSHSFDQLSNSYPLISKKLTTESSVEFTDESISSGKGYVVRLYAKDGDGKEIAHQATFSECEYPTLEDVFGVDKGNYD
eukprot:999225_1